MAEALERFEQSMGTAATSPCSDVSLGLIDAIDWKLRFLSAEPYRVPGLCSICIA